MDGEGCEIIGQAETIDPQQTRVSEDDDDSYSNEDSDIPEPSSNEYKTFVVLINDDGSLIVDRSGMIDAESSDPQCVIPVSLPVNKLRNPDNPFPGATTMSNQGGRTRKSKPQPVLYTGDDSGYDYDTSGNYVQISGTAPQIDMSELGPQDMAILENVLLQPNSGELLEGFDFPAEEGGNGTQGGGVHLWDHSYSALSATPVQQQVAASDSSISQTRPQVSKRVAEPLGIQIEDSTVSPRPGKSVIKANGPGRRPNVASPALSPASQQLSTSSSPTAHSPNIRRVSEGDSANIRRSQRHQDRVERQEAERIKAENQQMLQREKEMMQENHQSVIRPMEMSPSPAPVATPVMASPIFEEAVSVTGTSTPSSTSSMDKNARRPARSRKLPAHLADPNYIQLDEEGKPISQPISPSINADDSDSFVHLSSDTRDEESMDEEPGEKGEEDDPNKLWCICRQPHNNRFMICCDKCDDWFHGKCVGVTKQEAKKMESNNKQWHCPNCRKELKKMAAAAGQTPRRVGRPVGSGRRVSTASSQESESSEVFLPEKKKEISRSQSLIEPPKKQEVEKHETSTVSRRKSSSNITLQNIVPVTSPKSCMVCGNKARDGSVYCSDECVGRYATSTSKGKEEAPHSTATTPASELVTQAPDATMAQPKKLKRFLSLKSDQQKKAPDIFAFHVIQTGATKSTEMVPARPKEPAAVVLPTASRAPPSVAVTPDKNGIPKGSASPTKSTPPTGIPAKQFYSNDGAAKTPTPSKTEKESSASKASTSDSNKSGSRTKSSSRNSQGGKHAPDKRKSKEAIREAEKERDAIHGRDTESLIKQNMRKTLQEALKHRLSELQETDKASIPSENTPEKIAKEIEGELTLIFSTPNNPKCKTKYRSIVFNLKDGKNLLFREILQGNVTPQQLVKMEPTEMASEELSEWRQKEQEKNLEMIKRAELDKLVEAKKQELLDKGADAEAVEQEQSKKLDLADVLELKDAKVLSTDVETQEKPKDDKSGHSKSHSISRHHKSHTKDKHSGDRDRHSSRDKVKRDDRDHRSRHRSRERSTKSSYRGKESSKDKSVKEKKSEIKSSDRERSRSTNTRDRNDEDKLKAQSSKDEGHSVSEIPSTADSSNSEEAAAATPKPMDVSADNSSNEASLLKISPPIRQSTESDQELPSSTIKTPDFTEEKKDSAHAPIFKTKLLMHELGQFRASAYNVSHNSLDGVIFPPEPVPIVGRIAPETVWDYIDKMKKTKEVIILRLHPETDADYDGYMAFFKYLSSRGRLGVMGHVKPPLKDCYLIPLDKHSPVNRALLPFHGPGLPEDRDHCLLAAVTRHCEVAIAPQIKRKLSSDMPQNSLKKKKVGDAKSVSGKQRRDMLPSTSGIDAKAQKDFEKGMPSPDDDQPYTPWEEEDEKDPISSIPVVDEKTSAQKLLEEINRQIEQEKEQIANIAVAITRNENISIPGLDGDFPAENPSSDFGGQNLPFFLRADTPPGEVPPSSSLIASNNTMSYPPPAATVSPEKMDVDFRSGVNKFCDITDSHTPLLTFSSNTQNTPITSAVPPVVDLDEEAYSPSDYSEDCKVVSVTKDGVTVSEISETVPSSDIKSSPKNEKTPEPIPGFDVTPPNEEPPAKGLSLPSPSFTSFRPRDVELEPPPPGEIDAVTAPVLKAPKIALDSVFTRPLSTAALKPKIQINIKKKSDVQQESIPTVPTVSTSADEASTSIATAPVSNDSISFIPLMQHGTDAEISVKPGIIQSHTTYPGEAPTPVGSTTSSVPNLMPGVPTLPIVSIPPPGLVPYPPPMSLGPFPPGMAHMSRPPMIPIPPPTVGGIGINTSIPPPPIAGMVPTTSIPPPPIRGVSSINQLNQPTFGPASGNLAPNSVSSPSRFRPASRFSQQPPGGSGSSSQGPRLGTPSSLTPNKNPGGFQKVSDRYRPSRFSRYNRSRSRSPPRNRSRSRSAGRNRSRSRSRDRDRRRRRHSSNSKSRSPQSSRRRSRSRSRSPRFSSRSKSPSSKKRYSRSRSPGNRNRSRRRKSRSVSPDVSTPVVKK